MAKAKIVREAVETSAEFARKAYDEVLDFFGYGADADEIMSEVGNLSPQTRNVLKALERDDFLGFETPDQALKQFIENPVYTYENYDVSPQLKSALTKFSNNPPSKPSKTLADVNPRIGANTAPTNGSGLLGNLSKIPLDEAGKVVSKKPYIIKNPTRLDAGLLAQDSGQIRGLIDPSTGDMYVMDAYDGMHKGIADALGLDYDMIRTGSINHNPTHFIHTPSNIKNVQNSFGYADDVALRRDPEEYNAILREMDSLRSAVDADLQAGKPMPQDLYDRYRELSRSIKSGAIPTAAAGLLGAMALTQSEDAEAGKVKAAKTGAESLLDHMIKAWHGSAADFPKFDSQYIGTGEGSQAFGYGHYAADRRGLGEYYRDTASKLNAGRIAADALPDFGDAWMNRMAERLLMETGGDPQKASKVAYNLSQSAINDDFIGKYKSLSKAFSDLEIPDLKGKLYEVGIKVSPDEMLDWDKPISQQSDFIKSRLGIIGDPNEVVSLQSRRAELQSEYDRIVGSRFVGSEGPVEQDDFDSLFGSIDPREGQLLQEIQRINDRIADLTTPKDIRVGNSVIPVRVQDTYLGREIIEGGGKTPELSKELYDLGIRGVKFLDAASRKAGEGSQNYVVFSDDDIDILNKYLRPETAALGLIQALTNQDILDLNQQVAIDSGMAQLGYDKDRPESAMYNYGELLPIKRHKDTGEWSPAMTGILEEVMRGLLDIGESRKTGRIQNPNSLFEVLL